MDTNVVLIYIRNNKVTQKLENQLNLFSGEHNLIISVVTIGELKSLEKQNNWGKTKWQQMANVLGDFTLLLVFKID